MSDTTQLIYKFCSSIFLCSLIVYYFFVLLLSTTLSLDFMSLLYYQITNMVSRQVVKMLEGQGYERKSWHQKPYVWPRASDYQNVHPTWHIHF